MSIKRENRGSPLESLLLIFAVLAPLGVLYGGWTLIQERRQTWAKIKQEEIASFHLERLGTGWKPSQRLMMSAAAFRVGLEKSPTGSLPRREMAGLIKRCFGSRLGGFHLWILDEETDSPS